MTRPLCTFSTLGSHQLRDLQPLLKERRFKKGDVLAQGGKVSESVYVVKVGIAFWRRRGFDGTLRPIGVAGRGAIFGLSGFFGQPEQTSGVAISSGRLCEIPISALTEFAVRQPQIAELFAARQMAISGLIASWSAAMRVNGAVKQLSYAMLLLSEAQRANVIELPTQSGLAELLGTTRETVVRAMAVLEKSGSLRHIERNKFEISWAELMERLSSSGTGRPSPAEQPRRSVVLAQSA